MQKNYFIVAYDADGNMFPMMDDSPWPTLMMFETYSDAVQASYKHSIAKSYSVKVFNKNKEVVE